MGFFDVGYIRGLDYDNLPALVRAGQSREQILEEILDKWCTSFGVVHGPNESLRDAVDRHVQAGGYVLQGVALWDETVDGETDGRRGAPVDLGDLLRMVEQWLSVSGAGAEFEQRPDLWILLRGCRVYRCNADDLRIRPRFVSLGVRFDSASFDKAKFGDYASFFDAKFGDSASFRFAKFGDSASFGGATFGDSASFRFAKFGDSASFGVATFGGSASFLSATFGDSASFVLATFGKSASFRFAKFGKDGSFARANLNRADLREADLSQCDLRDVRGLVLDSTRVKDAQFSPRSNDDWSVLRRAYTGPRLIFNLLFLTAFFLPYVARTGYWVGVNRTELAAARVLADLRDYGASPRGEQAGPAAVLERALESTSRRLPGPENPDSRTSRVWRLVIGADRGTWFLVSAILLLVYNVLRALLTMFVAPMRDEEERSGVAPAYRLSSREEATPVTHLLARLSMRLARLWWAAYTRWTEAYGWLIWPHRVVTVLFWLAVASFAWNAWHWLMLDVWLPAATNAGP